MNSNMINSLMNMGKGGQSLPSFNPNQFKKMTSKLTKENLAQMVQQARAQGIPEEQIEQGLNIILNL